MKKFQKALLVFCALVYCFAVIKANFFTVSAGLEEPGYANDDLCGCPTLDLLGSLHTEGQYEKFKAEGLIDTHGGPQMIFKIAVKLGKTDGHFHRMSLGEAKKIVELNKDKGPEALLNAFTERQPYPDVMSGSGLIRFEYWLDDEGSEKIVMYPKSAPIYYSGYDIEIELYTVDEYKDYITSESEKVN